MAVVQCDPYLNSIILNIYTRKLQYARQLSEPNISFHVAIVGNLSQEELTVTKFTKLPMKKTEGTTRIQHRINYERHKKKNIIINLIQINLYLGYHCLIRSHQQWPTEMSALLPAVSGEVETNLNA